MYVILSIYSTLTVAITKNAIFHVIIFHVVFRVRFYPKNNFLNNSRFPVGIKKLIQVARRRNKSGTTNSSRRYGGSRLSRGLRISFFFFSFLGTLIANSPRQPFSSDFSCHLRVRSFAPSRPYL